MKMREGQDKRLTLSFFVGWAPSTKHYYFPTKYVNERQYVIEALSTRKCCFDKLLRNYITTDN